MCLFLYLFHSFSASRASSFPSFSNCEQHDNVFIICFSQKVHKCHLYTYFKYDVLKYMAEYFFFFFACGASKRCDLGFQSVFAQILTWLCSDCWILHVAWWYFHVALGHLCRLEEAEWFKLLPWDWRRARGSAPDVASFFLSSPPPLSHLNVPAVCLSVSTLPEVVWDMASGSWAASSLCDLQPDTTAPRASAGQLPVPAARGLSQLF